MKTARPVMALLIGAALALLAECSGNDYGYLFTDAGACADAASVPDAPCER